jgi:hypothetical protein
VTGPDGEPVPLVALGGEQIAPARSSGLYTTEGGGARSAVAVNVGDPNVSNLRKTSLSAAATAEPVTGGAADRPWWLYCAMTAFALALGEWWTWHRRITV